MPRRVWRSLDGPYTAPRPGDTVDLRGTTKDLAVQERKEILLSSYYAGIGSYFGGYSSVTTVPGRPWSLERGVKEAYGRVPWVHAAVRVIAVSQSRLRFGVKDTDKPLGAGGAVEIDAGSLGPVLNVRSNPVEFSYQLRQRVSTQWMLSPRGGFIETVPPKNAGTSKRILELRLLPAGRTRIVPDGDGNIDHFEVDPLGGVGRPRPIPPERVRWFREPHPTDPFAGLTPLEAAGLSVEMDYFARLFNRQFMANDGRPGGIVGVTDPTTGKGEPADDAELDRIERKFGGGPVDAGRLVVVDGTVTYTDVAKSQRDMQWKDAGIQARNEIFGVFLVPVSAIDASGRTFTNAGQEWVNFWTLMGVPHGDAFAWLFHDDVDGVPFLDYSRVRALREVEAEDRAEMRDEVQAGLRTHLSYAQKTGQEIGDEPGQFPDQPGTRALWLPAGLVPVAQNPDDQQAAESLAPVGSASQAAPASAGAADDPGAGGFDGGAPDGGAGGGGGFDGGAPDGGGAGFKAAKDAPTHLERFRQRRAQRDRRARAVGGGTHDDADKEDDRARPVEAALAAALTAMAQRQVAVALARARGTKARIGTRHWEPRPGEAWSTKQLDPNDVVDPTQWGEQAGAIAQQNLAPLAQQQYDETRQQAEGDDAALVAVLGPPVAGAAALLLAGEVAHLVTWLATSAANHGAELLGAVADAERADAARVAAGGAPAGVQPVVDAINAWAQRVPGWVQQVVPTSVAQAVEAGKHAVLTPLGDRVQREWRTRLDDRVREFHKAAEGQVAKGGDAFVVGGEQLRYPRDPLGSPGNVINCRCRTRWRLAARTEGKALAVGHNVIADVLATPAPSGPPAVRRRGADEAVPAVGGGGPRWTGRADRVDPVAALAGVTGRDHLAEILGVPESKDVVRTAAGEHAFHEPIGSPIGHGGGDWQATRILKVHDSRDLVEQGDRFVRVPGTGETRQCERCGKGHEVHVTVEDQHGAQHTVGTACARATGPAASKLKSVTSATATADRLEAQAAKAEEYQAQRRAALERIKATATPPAHTEEPSSLGSGTDFRLPTGERQRVIGTPSDKDRAYAVAQLHAQWYGRQLDQAVPKQPAYEHADVAEMKRKAAKARRKANDLLDAPSTVAGKSDPVAEMLEGKVRRVRTEGGVRRFHEPVGSPIVAHPGLAGLGGHDHAAAVAADAARPVAVPDTHRALANLLANRTIEGGVLHPPSGGPSPHFPGGHDHPSGAPHAKGDRVAVSTLAGDHAYNGTVHGVGPDGTVHVIPDGKTGASHVQLVHPSAVSALPADGGGATGDMAKAKAELAGKGQDVAGLMAAGMGAEAAAKEYARLLHNARFRYRRDRLKAEKAAGGKAVAAVVADGEQGPKAVTLAGIGQQLLDDPESVKLDKALAAEAGVQPKALYSVPQGSGADIGATPGGVEPGQQWYDKLTADTTEPVPVVGLSVGGYVVKHGLAVRRNGVSYLVETPTAGDPAGAARLEQAAKAYEAFLATVPGDRRLLQRGVALLTGKNPADDHWAEKFDQPGFTSAATGGRGGTTYWNGNAVHPGLAAHEFGHNLDSGAHLPDKWVSSSSAVLDGQDQGWRPATYDDRATGTAWKAGGELAGKFTETRADPSHPITPGADSPTVYAGHNEREDFAESVRLYLKDRREGKLGYLKPEAGQTVGTNVRFADLWPGRAKVLDAAFGVTSDYETPFVKQQQARAAGAVAARRLAIHEAVQTQGSVPEELGLADIMRGWGLSVRAAADAWQQADASFKATLAAKDEKDALEHVKELLSGQANAPEPGQVGELEATLVDGFGLTQGKAESIVAAGVSWHGQQLEAQAQAAKAHAAKLAAEQAVQDVLSLEDLPKEVQTVIRKRRANVKLRAKQKGATAEQAEAIAAQYEAEQVAKEAKKLGLSGQVLGHEVVKGKVAPEVHGQAKGPDLRVKPGGTGGSKGSATWLAKAGDEPAPHAKSYVGSYGKYGKPQQAKSNIAATLAARLNNEQDWETFRAYFNSGAHRGHNMAFELPPAGKEVRAFGDYTPEQRQELLDAEVSQRVSMWASTSGDSNPFAVMMQQAVKDELGVPGPVGVNDSQGTTQKEVDKRYPYVAAFYRRFVREQYDHTQEQLAADGIEWVVLYRGMGIERGSHEWAKETDAGHVPLQPVSSFSTAPTVAQRFAGHGTSKRMMIRGAVHRSQIMGSARTGFGCLNEKEYAVLAPQDEAQGRFQVRYFAGSKTDQIKAAFARPVKAPPSMSVPQATEAIKAKMGGVPFSPGQAMQRLAQTPAGQDVKYPLAGGGEVTLPRAAVVIYLENYGYDVSAYS